MTDTPIRSITAHTFPYDRNHDLYQEYYRGALRTACEEQGIEYAEVSGARSTAALSLLRTARHSYTLRKFTSSGAGALLIDSVAKLFARGPVYSTVNPGVYEVVMSSGETTKICIDAHDGWQIVPSLAEVCSTYFKTNFWPAKQYPANVTPAPNLNPLIGRNLPYFTAHRQTPKTLDLFAFFRIWGGNNEVDGIEHNLQLIESLARTNCSKYLCAYLVAGDMDAIGRRLSASGVEWTTKPMDKTELWERAAQSRLNIVRLGMHECSPWRMIDILSMGGVPVIDYGPQTRWPSPLVEGEHYLNLHVEPGSTHFAAVPQKLEHWLSEGAQLEAIARNTATYFDEHLAPASLGRFLVSTLQTRQAGDR